MSSCCTSGFSWHGHPQGRESKIFDHDVYIAGDDDDEKKDVAILFLHDIFGWTFGNNRLLADHFAKEVGGGGFLWWICRLQIFFLFGGWRVFVVFGGAFLEGRDVGGGAAAIIVGFCV